jgi:nitrous oxidase accessory protein
MMTAAVLEKAPGTPRTGLWFHAVLAVIALILVLSSLSLPLWQTNLAAPQYPDGLTLVAYGNRAVGDLEEVDSLNHYVGMRPFRIEEFPEVGLWPIGVAAAAGAVLVSVLFGTRLVGRLARVYLWLLPISILAVIQIRLFQFGHDLDPAAAFRMDGFTPRVVGPTSVWNFTAWSWPGAGVLVLLAAAAVVTFGPRIGPKLVSRIGAGTIVLVVAMGVLQVPALAHDSHHESHAGHEPARPVITSLLHEDTFDRFPGRAGKHHHPELEFAALIADTPDGGTLVLPEGVYRGNVVIDRPITVEGQGWPLVAGDRTGTVITITAPDVTIRGVQVTGSGPGPSGQPAGIRITADNVTLSEVVVDDSYMGIAVDGANKVRILDSLVRGRAQHGVGDDAHATGEHTHDHATGGRGDGISLWDVDSVLVRGTLVTDTRDGIYISFGEGVLIDSNLITHSRYGVHSMYARDLVVIENTVRDNLSALVLMYGGGVNVIRNQLLDNRSPSTGFGLLVKDVTEVEAVQNITMGNRVGMHLDGPTGGSEPIKMIANTIADNHFGVVFFPSAQASLTANSFVDNLVQVSREGRGTEDNVRWSERGWGNFWSTYRGHEGSPGRGAMPHVEGSASHRLLSRAPLLTAIASSPAMRLIDVMEQRWMLHRPTAIDHLPLTEPVSPAVTPHHPDPSARTALTTTGVAMFALAGGVILRSMTGGRHT